MENTIPIDNLHGNVINYSQIKNLPTRNTFLNKAEYDSVSNDISICNKLLFMPCSLHEMHLQEKKYEKAKYKIVLFGSLLDGRRATVVINGIQPYFELMLSDDIENSSEKAMEIFNELKQKDITHPESFKIIKGRKFKGFKEKKQTFVRFYFEKLKTRREAIKEIRLKGYETTSDDISSYYRMVCRDYLTTFSSWVYISNYIIRSYNTIRGSVFNIDIKDYIKCEEDITENPLLSKDNIMTACWDIETYSPDGQLPIPDNPEHRMFMIGITFQWYHSNNQLLRVCLVDHPCKPKPNYITIVCGDEKKLIKAFAKIMYKMKPEYYLGFNDSDYDWPWLIKRAKIYSGTLAFLAENMDATIQWKKYEDSNIFEHNYKKERVKIEADAYSIGHSLVFPGYINIDVRTVFRQLYPTAEKSNLNFYLALNKLGSKLDMPYQTMFRIYRELNALMGRRSVIKDALKQYSGLYGYIDCIYEYNDKDDFDRLTEEIANAADYCVIDSQRCHELMKIRSVIMDRREVADMSFTTMFDAFYRANGMKVRNLVIATGQKFGIRFSNITDSGIIDAGKYPGAYVFPPIKGLVTSKLSIMERFNNTMLNPDYNEWKSVSPYEFTQYYEIIDKYGATCCQDTISRIIEEYGELRKCFTDFLMERTGRPITGLDFSSLYPSLIMTYNLSPEYIITNQKEAKRAYANGHSLYKIKFMYNGKKVRGWSIRHDNKLDPNTDDCKFGVYPLILKELFDTRSQMKKVLHKYEKQKEIMDALTCEEFNKSQNKEKYENICFNFNYINSKQKALKVFMNTFYGESGNKRSPFFVLQLAGAITTAGQDNIKMVQRFVEKEKCGIYYGDSVTGDTPLILRNRITKQVYIKTIDDLTNTWEPYDQFKPGELNRIEKQQAICDLEIWSEGTWNDIHRVIRHKTNKKMYRVNTHTGVIDVTEDHSLMRPNRKKIKPSELLIGTELMHSFPIEFPEIIFTNKTIEMQGVYCSKCDTEQPFYEIHKTRDDNLKSCCKYIWNNALNRTKKLTTAYINNINAVSKKEAYIWGFFMANGLCGNHQYSNRRDWYWILTSQNIIYLNQVLEYLTICEPHIEFKILNTSNIHGVYKLMSKGYIKPIVEKYKTLFYDKRNYKLVPIQILNGSKEIRQSFYDGYIGDTCKLLKQNSKQSFCCRGKITSQCMYYLVKSLGYKYVSVQTQDYESDVYWLSIRSEQFDKNPIAVEKILKLPEVTQDMFVYDIETSKGSFGGGVGSLNCRNTDSLYLSMPEYHFDDLDKKYFTEKINKLEYWNGLVNKTFEVITPLKNSVNELLKEDNGTTFLKMAFEESLYPVAFLAKKKYYGIPHISIPNFSPKELFIRGLEVKKRGVSNFLKKVCMNIMWSTVTPENVYTLIQLVNRKIDEIYETTWDFKDFVMTDVFNPKKQNVKIHTFVNRMNNEGIEIKPYERFSYVITKKNPFKYDERGRKKMLMIGEKMELYERASNTNMEIDLDYYMKGSINGQLARLITYESSFHVEPASDDLDELKISEDKTYKNACKYIENYCGKYFTNYCSKGKIYQRVFRIARNVMVDNLSQVYGKETTLLLNDNCDIENIEEWLVSLSEKNALKCIKNYGKIHVDAVLRDLSNDDKNKKIKSLQDIYFSNKKNNLLSIRSNAFNIRHNLLVSKLRDNIYSITSIIRHNSAMIEKLSNKIKNIINIDNRFNDPNEEVPEFDSIPEVKDINTQELHNTANDEIESLLNNEKLQESINKLRYIYVNMLSNYNFIHKTRLIVEYLKTYRNKSIGLTIKPKKFDTKQYIKDSVDESIKDFKI